MKQGDQLQLTATPRPANATYRGVTFTSSNEAAATVDNDGLVTALKPGITTITATSTKYDNISAKCIITVEANEVKPEAVIINEVQQANIDMFIDPSYNYGGWIELYNSTESPVTLDGLYVQDDQGHRFALTTTRNGSIPAKGFLTLWFDHFSWWTPKTINFKLETTAATSPSATSRAECSLNSTIRPPLHARPTPEGPTAAANGDTQISPHPTPQMPHQLSLRLVWKRQASTNQEVSSIAISPFL